MFVLKKNIDLALHFGPLMSYTIAQFQPLNTMYTFSYLVSQAQTTHFQHHL